MSDDINFTQQLRTSIMARAQQLDQSVASEMKDNWRSYQTNLEAVYGLLIKKGLLREDPYKKDHHIAEILAPKDAPLGESYKEDELSVRLSEFTSLLDYINHYSSFSVGNLDLKQLKQLHGTLNFIRFTDFSPNSTKNTTRAFAEVVEKIKKGSDQLASGAIQSSLNQLSEIVRKLEKNLKELSQFKREEYKLQVREQVLDRLDIGNSVPHEIFISQLKKEFQKQKLNVPFYSELIEEIYSESFGENGEELRQKVLGAVEVKKKESSIRSNQAELKPLLIDALRALANSTRHIDTALEKIRSNSALIENRPKSFMEKFKEWVVAMTSGKQEKIIYEIELVDPATSIHHTKSLDFDAFMASAVKKTKSLNGLLTKGSTLYQKLMNASEEQVFSFLDKSSRDVMEINKTMDALDTFFKTEVSRYERDKIRGIKNEVAAVKGSIHNASQKKHEYVAKKEERDQLKKLGIQ
jgi:hypothetical protein